MRKQTGEEQAEVHDGTMVVVFHWQNLQSDYATRVPHEHNHYSYDYSLENQSNHVVLLLAQRFFLRARTLLCRGFHLHHCEFI